MIDRLDQCPTTPAGHTVNAQGCEMDDDKDNVLNSLDQCPDTPANRKVDDKGCTVHKVINLNGVNFELDSAKLRPESFSILNQAADTLRRYNYPTTEVAGHTDNLGNDQYNLKLSINRARAVLEYLVNMGCPSTALKAKCFGESAPIADNQTETGREENRRVELRVMP